MDSHDDRRIEQRLRYSWPIWFAEDFTNVLNQGQMVDITSSGAAFTCYSDCCPSVGEHITARFSVPKFENSDTFDLENYVREGYVRRIDETGPFTRRIAICFTEPLPFKPAERQMAEQFTCV